MEAKITIPSINFTIQVHLFFDLRIIATSPLKPISFLPNFSSKYIGVTENSSHLKLHKIEEEYRSLIQEIINQ